MLHTTYHYDMEENIIKDVVNGTNLNLNIGIRVKGEWFIKTNVLNTLCEGNNKLLNLGSLYISGHPWFSEIEIPYCCLGETALVRVRKVNIVPFEGDYLFNVNPFTIRPILTLDE